VYIDLLMEKNIQVVDNVTLLKNANATPCGW